MIKKPITILGSSTSVIEIGEAVLIDLSKYSKLNKTVSLSECNIHFNYNKRLLTPNNSMSTKRKISIILTNINQLNTKQDLKNQKNLKILIKRVTVVNIS